MENLRKNIIFYNFLRELLKKSEVVSTKLKYAYLQDGFLYITDTKMLFKIKVNGKNGHYMLEDEFLKANSEFEAKMPELLEKLNKNISNVKTQKVENLSQMYKKDFDDGTYSFDIENWRNLKLFKFLRLCTINKITYFNKQTMFHIDARYNGIEFELYVV